MKSILFALGTCAALLTGMEVQAQSAAPMAQVTGWGMHYGGMVHYRYQVKNTGARPLTGLLFGISGVGEENGKLELSVGPLKDPGATSFWVSPRAAIRPEGWGVSYHYEEESQLFGLQWVEGYYHKATYPGTRPAPYSPKLGANPQSLAPGSTSDRFAVFLPKMDAAYVNGHVMVEDEMGFETIQITKGDAIAPGLDMVVRRHDHHPQDEWAEFQIHVRTWDNYDPHPQLSVKTGFTTPGSGSGDTKIHRVHGRWIVKFKNVPGQKYQLLFSSTDASGNATIKAFDYSVPRAHGGRSSSRWKEN